MKIGIVGAGAMGSGIAQVAAQAGHAVVVCDMNAQALEKSRLQLHDTLERLVEKGKIDAVKGTELQQRIYYSPTLSSLSDCGLVIEAIVENIEIKKALFAELESIVNDSCILATNTSSLSVTAIAGACKNPTCVVGIHFFNPAPLMPLVEIIPALQTENDVLEKTKTLITSWGKTTVIATDTPGFIVNRVARPFYGEALRIYDEGIADIATIDWAMKQFGGFRMGPFELMDMIGNDVNYAVTESVFHSMYYDPKYKPSLTQKKMVDANRLGKKTGRGYYDYAPGFTTPQPVIDEYMGKEIMWRVVAMLVNEAYDALYYRIASREDLEIAMTRGVNYPKGLIAWSEEVGLANCVAAMDKLYDTYREDRYRCSPLLRKMATS